MYFEEEQLGREFRELPLVTLPHLPPSRARLTNQPTNPSFAKSAPSSNRLGPAIFGHPTKTAPAGQSCHQKPTIDKSWSQTNSCPHQDCVLVEAKGNNTMCGLHFQGVAAGVLAEEKLDNHVRTQRGTERDDHLRCGTFKTSRNTGW